jgi:hypothetical protein
MWNFILAHQVTAGVVLMWVVSTAIGAMPTPKDGSSGFYVFLFQFAQGIGGAIPRLLAIYAPTTLSSLTGQTVKTTTPPNPPITEAVEERIATPVAPK